MAGRTVFTVLEETARRYGDAAALHQPLGGKANLGYRSYSWNEWALIAREVALGLHALGLEKGQIVCILSETRAEFYLVDLGIMAAGGVAAALYTAYPMPDLARNLRETGARFLFIEDSHTLGQLRRAAEQQGESLPPHIFLMTGEGPNATSLEELRRLGRDLLARDPSAFERVQESVSPQDPAILYLTSGATGEPKMGLSTHAGVLANVDMGPTVLPTGPSDSILAFLPSAHIAQRIVLELVPMGMGTPIWFSESLARLSTELRSIRPTIFFAPPRVWEKMFTTVQSELKKQSAAARKLFDYASRVGAQDAKLRIAKKPLPFWMTPVLKLADKLIFIKVRERLGGRIRIAASGAAPLGKGLADFFAAIRMPIVEGYGLTEAGVVSFNPLDRPKPGSIGKLLPGVEARLAEDGELEVRTPCMFLGYYKDEAATRSVLSEDGWFSTGDIAEVDSEGYWYITGRKKELIVSSNGKKIYPARIESLFKMEPLVNQVLLIGDKRPYVTALLTLNTARAESLDGIGETVDKAVQEAVARVNKQLAEFERVRRFKILERDFSIEHGELTPTMKIRRSRVLQNHEALVNELYLGRGDGE